MVNGEYYSRDHRVPPDEHREEGERDEHVNNILSPLSINHPLTHVEISRHRVLLESSHRSIVLRSSTTIKLSSAFINYPSSRRDETEWDDPIYKLLPSPRFLSS